MDKSAIEKIVELGAPNLVVENGYNYTDKPLTVIKEPVANTVYFKTLKGITDTLKAEISHHKAPVIVSVISHDQVEVLSALNVSDRNREKPYVATAETPNLDFDRYISNESMLIQLKSKFLQTSELLELVQLLGTIVDENSLKLMDDGFSQSVTVKKGIALKDNKVINPRIKLTPYRTFLDVEQPASEFLLRLQEGGSVALFEADGGAWKLKARKNVAQRLSSDLADLIKQGQAIIVE